MARARDNQYSCGFCCLELSDDEKVWVRPCSKCVIAEINKHIKELIAIETVW